MPKILIVDDEQGSRAVLRRLLAKTTKCELLEACDGAQGLDIIRSQKPDLVVCDLLMPVMDGFEMLRQVRLDPTISETPIIFLSGAYQGGEAELLAQAGKAIGIVRKPLRREEILKAVEKALQAASPLGALNSEAFEGDHRRLLTGKLAHQTIAYEEAVQAGEERFRRLIKLLPAAVYTCDAEGRITLFSNGAVQLWGREPELGKDRWCGCQRLYESDGRELAFEECPMAIAIRQGRSVRGPELVVERFDGTHSFVWPHADPIRDDEGKIIGAVTMLIDVTERRQAEDNLRTANEQLHMLSRRLFDAQENERRNISRELHDEIGQILTTAKINAANAASTATNANTRMQLEESIALLDRLIQQVRQMSLNLRPPLLDTLGLVPALRAHLAEQTKHTEVRGCFSAGAIPENLDRTLQLACFRVAQEAITNAIRHAKAHQIHLEIHLRNRRLELIIRDDGVGFSLPEAEKRARRGGSLGLTSIKERVTLLGGWVNWFSAPGKGTEVEASFPLATAPGL